MYEPYQPTAPAPRRLQQPGVIGSATSRIRQQPGQIQNAPYNPARPATAQSLPYTAPSLAQRAAPANPSLGADPGFNAYVRTLGLGDSLDESDSLAQIDAISRMVQRTLPRIAQAGGYEREGISGGYEDRGLLRSGMHETAIARQRASEGQRIGDVQQGASDDVLSLLRALARRRAVSGSQVSEAGLDAASRLYPQI